MACSIKILHWGFSDTMYLLSYFIVLILHFLHTGKKGKMQHNSEGNVFGSTSQFD